MFFFVVFFALPGEEGRFGEDIHKRTNDKLEGEETEWMLTQTQNHNTEIPNKRCKNMIRKKVFLTKYFCLHCGCT